MYFPEQMWFSYCEGNMITEYQALSDCQSDITGHLKMLKMCGVLSEKELILLRAGKDIFCSPLFTIFPSRVKFVHCLVSTH